MNLDIKDGRITISPDNPVVILPKSEYDTLVQNAAMLKSDVRDLATDSTERAAKVMAITKDMLAHIQRMETIFCVSDISYGDIEHYVVLLRDAVHKLEGVFADVEL